MVDARFFCSARVIKYILIVVAFSLSLAGCDNLSTPSQGANNPFLSPTQRKPSPKIANPQPPVTPSFIPISSPTETKISQSPIIQPLICSPLEYFSIHDVLQIVSTQFEEPRPGQDGGHHGVDFAFWHWGDIDQMLGLHVNAIFSGRVAGVLPDRPPYGYAVIIETPATPEFKSWIGDLWNYQPNFINPGDTRLTCPPLDYPSISKDQTFSLYHLYAHLNIPSPLLLDQGIACGELIGEVGTTGSSINPHLHLEMRIGPSGKTFPDMAHYDNQATIEEMESYCTWRISGIFQLLDPVRILQLGD